MYINIFGSECYLDEPRWVERMTPKAMEGPPWQMEEIVAIQQQMKTLDDYIFEYVKRTATPDPIDTLRKHLDEMIVKETTP